MCDVTLKCEMFPLGRSGASHCSSTLEVATELTTTLRFSGGEGSVDVGEKWGQHLLGGGLNCWHQLPNMHSLVSGVVAHSSSAAGDSAPPSYWADTSKQYSANPSTSFSVYEVALTTTDLVLRSDCRFTNWFGSHQVFQLYCIW